MTKRSNRASAAEQEITERLIEMVGWLLRAREQDALPVGDGAPTPRMLPASLGGTDLPHRHEARGSVSADWAYMLAIRMLGFSLHAVGGTPAMLRGVDAVERKYGPAGTLPVDRAWVSVGGWCP